MADSASFASVLSNKDNIHAFITCIRIPIADADVQGVFPLNGANCIRLCNWTTDVEIEEPDNQAEIYTPFPLQIAEIGVEAGNRLPSLQIGMPITLELAPFIRSNYLSVLGRPVTLYVTTKDLIDTTPSIPTSKFVRFVFYIENFSINNNMIILSLTVRFNLFKLQGPRRDYLRNHCPYRYTIAPDCPYNPSILEAYTTVPTNYCYFTRYGQGIDHTSLTQAQKDTQDQCGKTIYDCRIRQEATKRYAGAGAENVIWNTLPFGGFPTVPSGDPRRI